MNDWAKTKSFSVIWKASNAKRFDLHKFWMNKQSLWSLTWQTFIWYEAKQICLCLNLTIKIQYRLTILKYKDWLVKSASKKQKKNKNENSPPNTTIEKSWWLLCTKSRFTYNKANQLSKILFYQDISIFAKCYLPKSASCKPNLFQPYLWHIHFFFFFKTVNSADLCFKISPKTCRQYKKTILLFSPCSFL